MATKRILVRGLVQGVCFRIATVAQARSLNLNGRVCNLPDGRVEILVEGPDRLIDKLVGWARSGPPGARVEGIEVSPAPPGGWTNFRITG